MFGRRPVEAPGPQKPALKPESIAAAGTPCGSLGRVLARAFREPKAEILHIGPLCGESVVYLASRGARVSVEDFVPPPPTPPRQPGEILIEKAPIRCDYANQRFHLILAWELADYVPPDRLADFGAELLRMTREGGWLFLFSHAKPASALEPLTRYRLLADDLVVREFCETAPIPRYVHPNRDLERAFTGFAIQGIQLQRSQMREIVALKAGVGA